MTSMNFLFRKPRFPLIIDTGFGLLGAKSWAVCESRLATITFPDIAPRDVIDSTAEAFSLYPEHIVFSPPTFKKRWTKAAIIELYNGSKGPGRPEYPTTSLDNKSMEKVVKGIVELLSEQRSQPSGCSGMRLSHRGSIRCAGSRPHWLYAVFIDRGGGNVMLPNRVDFPP